MSYFMRLFGTSNKTMPLASMQGWLKESGYGAEFDSDEGEENNWTHIALRHKSGNDIADIERNPVEEYSLGHEEVAEFRERLLGEVFPTFPRSSAEWISEYLIGVKVIYCFRILYGSEEGQGWDILHYIQRRLDQEVGGLWHAEAEGFSNQDGYHITWEFSDEAKGECAMAVLVDGRWMPFKISLDNPSHREAFQSGCVPEGVEMIDPVQK